MDEKLNKKIEAFFTAYEGRFNDALVGKIDAEETASAFADCFIEANPFGVNCGKNDNLFLKVIPEGYKFYKSIGAQAMKIVAVTITHLDAHHAMVKAHWRSHYKKKDGHEVWIEFDVIYFVQIVHEQIKIFAYITGDEQGVLHERGLL